VIIRSSLAIAWANMVRLFRDRLGLFFVIALPLIIIFVLGLQFGGGFQARVGVVVVERGALADQLVQRLEEDWQVVVFSSEAELREDVESGRLEAGVVLPERYDQRLATGEPVTIEFVSPGGDFSLGRRTLLEASVAEQAAVARAASFAADETGGSAAALIGRAQALQSTMEPINVELATVGESLFPEELTGFALGAQGQLVLFVFLTSLTGATQLIVTRTLGVSRRMLSTPTPIGAILFGEALGRFGTALFQAVFIIAATALLFGVVWGDPLGVTVLALAFSLVGAGIAMLIGSIANDAEQASSIGVFVGLGVAALGGAMVPPEIFPEPMATISWVTPHRWALDGFRELILGASLSGLLLPIGVLLAEGVILLALATWRLRVALTR
jgi:ABC-2 type transport system permease protein